MQLTEIGKDPLCLRADDLIAGNAETLLQTHIDSNQAMQFAGKHCITLGY